MIFEIVARIVGWVFVAIISQPRSEDPAKVSPPLRRSEIHIGVGGFLMMIGMSILQGGSGLCIGIGLAIIVPAALLFAKGAVALRRERCNRVEAQPTHNRSIRNIVPGQRTGRGSP